MTRNELRLMRVRGRVGEQPHQLRYEHGVRHLSFSLTTRSHALKGGVVVARDGALV